MAAAGPGTGSSLSSSAGRHAVTASGAAASALWAVLATLATLAATTAAEPARAAPPATQVTAMVAPGPGTAPAAAVPPLPARANAPAAANTLADPELRAQLTPRRYTTLAAEIGARVQQVTVTDGSPIRAGQLLVSFDCSLQRAQHDRARATLEAADKALVTQRRLVELNATGRQEVDQAEAEVGKTRAEMAQIDVQLAKCQVHAPFSGRVAEQRVRDQQYVQPGQPLLEILDDSVLEIDFIMPSRWLQQVRQGSLVQIAIDETGKTYPARVQRLGARVDPVSQSVKVVAAIEGRHGELMAGMSGRVIVKRTP